MKRYEVWQRYFEDGEMVGPEYVMGFDNYTDAQNFANGLSDDPDCEAWVEEKQY